MSTILSYKNKIKNFIFTGFFGIVLKVQVKVSFNWVLVSKVSIHCVIFKTYNTMLI
ncbi:hypothetical protein Hanom_Chr05g00432421 [Helianthus anomalus]